MLITPYILSVTGCHVHCTIHTVSYRLSCSSHHTLCQLQVAVFIVPYALSLTSCHVHHTITPYTFVSYRLPCSSYHTHCQLQVAMFIIPYTLSVTGCHIHHTQSCQPFSRLKCSKTRFKHSNLILSVVCMVIHRNFLKTCADV